mmetsp:Transcript_64361/g.199287  ORF Transcript_64361/g.199287 Transcript_64361/m.199287 type:complete len:241 (-) Transcript_64361:43-765(-)
MAMSRLQKVVVTTAIQNSKGEVASKKTMRGVCMMSKARKSMLTESQARRTRDSGGRTSLRQRGERPLSAGMPKLRPVCRPLSESRVSEASGADVACCCQQLRTSRSVFGKDAAERGLNALLLPPLLHGGCPLSERLGRWPTSSGSHAAGAGSHAVACAARRSSTSLHRRLFWASASSNFARSRRSSSWKGTSSRGPCSPASSTRVEGLSGASALGASNGCISAPAHAHQHTASLCECTSG